MKKIFFKVSGVLIAVVFLLSVKICYADKDSAQKAVSFDKEAFIESAKEKKVLRVGLIDCISYALKSNSEIKVILIEPKIKHDEIKIEQADFEPAFSVDYSLEENKEESPSSAYPAVLETRDIDLNAGVSGKFIIGTEYGIDFLNKKYESNLSSQSPNPYYTTEPKITITQPLFRDFGMPVNRADIIIAQNNMFKSKESVKETVTDILSKTKTSYYNYYYYTKRYFITLMFLDWTKELLEIVKERYSKGLASSVDVLEIEASVAQRTKELLSMESFLKKSGDELKLITNLVDDSKLWNAEIELIDEPQLIDTKVEIAASLEDAFKNRYDYRSKKIELESKDIKIAAAKNSLFPTIDLTGSFGLNGLGAEFSEALKNIDSDYEDWNAGLKVTLPWGGEERAVYDKRKFEKAKELIEFKRLEQNIILEVRDKVRGVDIQYRQVEASKLAYEKERDNYGAQEKRYIGGQVSTHDLLDYRFRMAEAEFDYIKALIDYNTALIELDKATGTTLVKNNVNLEGL